MGIKIKREGRCHLENPSMKCSIAGIKSIRSPLNALYIDFYIHLVKIEKIVIAMILAGPK